MTPKSGKAIAWFSFSLGILVSIAGNIGHAASDGMKPGEWAGAAFWPLALMLTIEILTRVRWQPERRWTIARFAALVLVALVAAVLSYRHLAGLMTYWGEDWANAHLGPLAVDGLMLIAATALLSISKEQSAPTVEADPVGAEIDQLLTTLEEDRPTLINNMETGELEPKPPKVETSKNVPSSAAEEAAFQAWMNAPRGQKPSVRKLADMTGLSASKVHRLINGTGTRPGWKTMETAR
jgi:hypothetical protein